MDLLLPQPQPLMSLSRPPSLVVLVTTWRIVTSSKCWLLIISNQPFLPQETLLVRESSKVTGLAKAKSGPNMPTRARHLRFLINLAPQIKKGKNCARSSLTPLPSTPSTNQRSLRSFLTNKKPSTLSPPTLFPPLPSHLAIRGTSHAP